MDLSLNKRQSIWIYLFGVIYVILNTFLIAQEFYWFALFPAVLLFVYLYFFKLDIVLLIITAFTPFAVNISSFDIGLGVSLPTEPLMVGLLIVFLLKYAFDHYPKKILLHPVSLGIIFQLIWMTITIVTSEMPLVSLKFVLARYWFIIPFYFFAIMVFKNQKRMFQFLWSYSIPLLMVVVYTLIRHASYSFEEQPGHWVMDPFYNDHTAYGAALGIFVPIIIGLFFHKKYNFQFKTFIGVAIFIIGFGLVMSISRAAWVSVAGAIGVLVIIQLRIKFKWVFLGIVLVVGGFFMLRTTIIQELEKNKEHEKDGLVEQVQSISNISNDASNLERINRWSSAIRMFKERPVFGWGPGTYQFVYAPFQSSREQTIISTNAGTLGSTHSEYLRPLSEQGFMGTIAVLWIIIATIATSLKVYNRDRKSATGLLSLISLLGLVTYYVHGLLNDFLETDKLAVPFWGLTAIIVALDLFHQKKADNSSLE